VRFGPELFDNQYPCDTTEDGQQPAAIRSRPIRPTYPDRGAAQRLPQLGFHRAAEAIEVGHELAARALDILEKPATPALDP
jgi:hypothetical protein